MPRVRKPKQASEESTAAAAGNGAAAPGAAAPAAAPAPAVPDMTLVLRTADAVTLRRVTPGEAGTYSAADVVGAPVTGGDFTECEPVCSADGELVACSSLKAVVVVSAATAEPVAVIDEPGITALQFSPTASMLVTYRMQDAKVQGDGNLAVWRLTPGVAPGYQLAFRVGQSTWPAVWWSADEAHFVRRAQGHLLQVFDGKLESKDPVSTLDLQTPRGKDPVVAPAPGDLPFVAVFVPQVKSNMGHCKVYRLPNLKDDLLARTLGNADDAVLRWNCHGTALVVLATGERDKTGGSYYGRATLTVMHVKDRNCYSVVVGKDDGVHDCAWSPTADEFIVVHGTMPRNKATLYNAQAQPIYSFGEAPRNFALWAPDGKMFVLSGNGNLAGESQFYMRDAIQKQGGPVGAAAAAPKPAGASVAGADGKLGFFSEKSSQLMWTPDSRAVVSANVFTKLRLDNKLTFWKHTGAQGYHEKFDKLFSAAFVPIAHKKFRPRAPSPTVKGQEASKPQAYRPPGASSAAAAMLARKPGSAIGNAVRPTSAGPVGATVVAPAKRGGRR